ncbi:uncharacterized protein LOC134223289 [Armigeres subalbatus]|uniref:uncharacterized protein LOC134223289 n=1 Tax=Armigeres subalbatus TaxID=124917 RepID=UPI002ED55A91
MNKVQYDMAEKDFHARRRCCSPVFIVVWLILALALVGGFATAFFFHQYSDRNCPSGGTIDGSAEGLGSGTTELQLAFVKTNMQHVFMVIHEKFGVLSKPEEQGIEEFGSCLPEDSKQMLVMVPPGNIFVLHLRYDGEGRCVYGFLRHIGYQDGEHLRHKLVDALIDNRDVLNLNSYA